MLRTWLKDQCRNVNVYQNIYSHESGFLFKGNLTIRFYYKLNEQTKYGFKNSYFK